MRKPTSKTTPKSAKAKAPRPLKISIHGDGIDIDATLGDGAGFRTLVQGLQNAAASRVSPQAADAPAGRALPLEAITAAMLDHISAASPELLREIDALLDTGKRAVQARAAQPNAASSAPPNGTAPSNSAAAST